MEHRSTCIAAAIGQRVGQDRCGSRVGGRRATRCVGVGLEQTEGLSMQATRTMNLPFRRSLGILR